MILLNANYINEKMMLKHGDIKIINNRIEFISEIDKTLFEKDEVIDCSDYIIMPGMVNAHYHNLSSISKGLFKDIEIQDWFNDSVQGKCAEEIYDEAEQKLTEEKIRIIIMKEYCEMLKQGITLVNDMGTIDGTIDIGTEVINAIGMRGIIDTLENIDKYYNKQRGNVSYSTHLLEEEDIDDTTLEECINQKKQYAEALFTTHCLENKWREDIIYKNYNKSTIQLYNELDLLDDKTLLYHCTKMNINDIESLNNKNVKIVHCPISNAETGAGIADIANCLRKGVCVSLGTDWGHVNIFDVMKMSYYLLKVTSSINEFSAEDIYKMSTIYGTKALGLEHNLGLIKENYIADLIFVNKNSFSMSPFVNVDEFSNFIHNFVTEGSSELIENVMIEGKWVIRNKNFVNLNYNDISKKYNNIINNHFIRSNI